MSKHVGRQWKDGKWLDVPVCCPEMARAMQPCTDNEGYGALIALYDQEYNVGCDLPPMSYCPWCGTRIDTA